MGKWVLVLIDVNDAMLTLRYVSQLYRIAFVMVEALSPIWRPNLDHIYLIRSLAKLMTIDERLSLVIRSINLVDMRLVSTGNDLNLDTAFCISLCLCVSRYKQRR